jgi:hypothetical protein
MFGPPPPGIWVCDPCGDSARTLISLREPKCPFCGRKYQADLRSMINDAGDELAERSMTSRTLEEWWPAA